MGKERLFKESEASGQARVERMKTQDGQQKSQSLVLGKIYGPEKRDARIMATEFKALVSI